jgi:hypothetical protein
MPEAAAAAVDRFLMMGKQHVCLQLNMFWAISRPSSGAQ